MYTLKRNVAATALTVYTLSQGVRLRALFWCSHLRFAGGPPNAHLLSSAADAKRTRAASARFYKLLSLAARLGGRCKTVMGKGGAKKKGKKGKKGGGGDDDGGENAPQQAPPPPSMLLPDVENYVTLEMNLMNWRFMNFKMRIRTETHLFTVKNTLAERHGRIKDLVICELRRPPTGVVSRERRDAARERKKIYAREQKPRRKIHRQGLFCGEKRNARGHENARGLRHFWRPGGQGACEHPDLLRVQAV